MNNTIISILFVLLSSVATSWSANREAYKVILDQSVYPQYLLFNLVLSNVGEFTICTWFNSYDLNATQNLITYSVRGHSEMMMIWINAGGRSMQAFVYDEMTQRIPVILKTNNWHHICFTHQSEDAAIGLYLDSSLIYCGFLEPHNSYILPPEGMLIIGKSMNDRESGFNGEIYGTNMILASTLEKKHTKSKSNLNQSHNPIQRQKLVNYKYSLKEKKNIEDLHDNFNPYKVNKVKHFNLSQTTILPKIIKENKVRFSYNGSNHNEKLNIPMNASAKTLRQFSNEQRKSVENNLKQSNQKTPITIFVPEWISATSNKSNTKLYADELSENETPPPVFKDTKVYGQWTSSNYAGKLFKYAQNNIVGHSVDILKNPPTIPLGDKAYPYPNRFVTPPSYFHRRYKRDRNGPQINVKIVEDDYRNTILKTHKDTKATSVEVTNRGSDKSKHEKRSYSSSAHDNLRIDLKKGLTPINRLRSSGQLLTSHSEEVNFNNAWDPFEQVAEKFGIKESLQDLHQVKIPLTKVVTRKGSDVPLNFEPIELNNLNNFKCPETAPSHGGSFKNQEQPADNQIVLVYPKKSNYSNVFQGDVFEKIFNRNVKLGNALSENKVIKKNEEKVSFEGSYERIPKINRFFSDSGYIITDLPGSLSSPCEMAKIHDRRQTGKKTDVKANIAKEFVEIAYKQCSLDKTALRNHRLLIIYWDKSTVSLFGGARHTIAKDPCGYMDD